MNCLTWRKYNAYLIVVDITEPHATGKKPGFILKGLIRAYRIKDDGDDVTLTLRRENQFTASYDTVTLFTVVGFIINVYGHLGYEISTKQLCNSVLFEVLNTSVHHNIHYSKFKGNYGLYFRVWDRLMDTEHPDYVAEYDRIQQKRFGKPRPSIAEKVIETAEGNSKAA